MFKTFGNFCIALFIIMCAVGIAFPCCELISEIMQEIRKVKEKKQLKRVYRMKNEKLQELIALMDGYMTRANPNAEETKETWAKCCSLLEILISDDRSSWEARKVIPKINAVSEYLLYHKAILCNMRNDQTRNFINVFVAKLWDFYNRIAFTYDLELEGQTALLRYLLRSDDSYRYGDHYSASRRSEAGDIVDLQDWDAKRIALLEEGCRKNSPIGFYLLAECYYDYDKAFELYQRAAQLGYTPAIYMLGQCYAKGRGTKKNYQKAGDCYQYGYNITNDADFAKAVDALYTAYKWDKNRYSPDIFTGGVQTMQKANLVRIKEEVAKYAQTDLNTADPRILAVSVRMVLEEIVNSFVECFESTCVNNRLDEKITLLQNKGYFTKEIANQAHGVRMIGNRAAHNSGGEAITVDDLQQVLSDIAAIAEYYEQY